MLDKKSIILKCKYPGCFTQGSGHGKLVQLVFVNHMSNLAKLKCRVYFALHYTFISAERIRANERHVYLLTQIDVYTVLCIFDMLMLPQIISFSFLAPFRMNPHTCADEMMKLRFSSFLTSKIK